MFVGVDTKDLVPGTKYAMSDSYKCTYTGIFECHGPSDSQGFSNWKEHTNTFNIPRNKSYYYKFVPQKEKIQQAMEQRALDKILKRLVNEDFTW